MQLYISKEKFLLNYFLTKENTFNFELFVRINILYQVNKKHIGIFFLFGNIHRFQCKKTLFFQYKGRCI